jgi:hypothetical protein
MFHRNRFDVTRCRGVIQIVNSEKGSALPSVLFLITLLSLFAATILALQYFHRKAILLQVAKVKAQYASESGLASLMGNIKSLPELYGELESEGRSFQFNDGSIAHVKLQPWGFLLRATSEGKFQNARVVTHAIIASRPSQAYDNALIFANNTHQLVFTGQSTITGNIITGQPGVSIGNIHDYSSPLKIPVKGKINSKQPPELPAFDTSQVNREMIFWRYLLGQSVSTRTENHKTLKLQGSELHINAGTIPDSIDYLFLDGRVFWNDTINRRDVPLYIVTNGDIILEKDTKLLGLVTIITSGTMTLDLNVKLDQTICYSLRSIHIQHSVNLLGQFIAPEITIASGSYLHYPSMVYSSKGPPRDSATTSLKIDDGATVEGMVALMSENEQSLESSLITIAPTAKVIGSVYTNSKITLDGSVIGTVLAKDFYFYVAPTSYLGWIRSGTIDRASLPKSYLIPPSFTENVKLDILDWL